MSRYLATVPQRSQAVAKPTSSGKCDACGWDFTAHHSDEIIKADGTKTRRSVVRDEIRRPIYQDKQIVQIVTRCGDCFEREQYVMRTHRYAGCEAVESMHRSSIAQALDHPAKVA